jgi:hypothetical protein
MHLVSPFSALGALTVIPRMHLVSLFSALGALTAIPIVHSN